MTPEELPAQSVVPVLHVLAELDDTRPIHHGRLGGAHDHHEGALMERRIRRLGVFMVLCFIALFIQLNNIQVLKANSLANNQDNPRVQLVERSQTRGSILSADGVTLASSVPAPKAASTSTSGSTTHYTATLFAQIVGFDSIKYGNFRASRPSTTATSPPTPGRPRPSGTC